MGKRRTIAKIGTVQDRDFWLGELMSPPTEEQFCNPRVSRMLMAPEQEVMTLPEKARKRRVEQVADLVREGKSKQEVAEALGIKDTTVYFYAYQAVKDGLLESNPYTVDSEVEIAKEKPVTEKAIPLTETAITETKPTPAVTETQKTLRRGVRELIEDLGLEETADLLATLAKTALQYHDVEQVVVSQLGEGSSIRDAVIEEAILTLGRMWKDNLRVE